MKLLWIVLAASMAVGVYFTPPPMPGESSLAYILSDRSTWQATAAVIVASMCGSALLMIHLMRGDR